MNGLSQYIYHDEGKKMYFGRQSKKYQFDIDYEIILKDMPPTLSPTNAPAYPTLAPTESAILEKYLEE